MPRAWFYEPEAEPIIGQERVSYRVAGRSGSARVRVLRVLSHEATADGRDAWLCDVRVLAEEPLPENVTPMRRK